MEYAIKLSGEYLSRTSQSSPKTNELTIGQTAIAETISANEKAANEKNALIIDTIVKLGAYKNGENQDQFEVNESERQTLITHFRHQLAAKQREDKTMRFTPNSPTTELMGEKVYAIELDEQPDGMYIYIKEFCNGVEIQNPSTFIDEKEIEVHLSMSEKMGIPRPISVDGKIEIKNPCDLVCVLPNLKFNDLGA